MKRFLSLALALLLMACQPVFAADWETGVLINAEQLDNSPTSYTSSALNVHGASKIGFYVAYDETQVGNTIQGTFTIETSYDGTNWVAASFFDYVGGAATFVTSEVITADGYYYCWMHTDSPLQFVRVKMAGTNTDADDIIVTSVNYVLQK